MQLAMIGLGRMGANMVRRLIRAGHQCVVFDMSPKAVADLAREMIDRIKSGCGLEVDGGIDATTAPLAVAAGADVLVAGSAIFNDSEGVTAAMQRLRATLQR